MRTISTAIAGLVLAVAGSAVSADVVAFDQMTAVANTTWNIPTATGVPTGSGNRQMGGIVNLAGTDTQISGFDLSLLNSTGAAISNTAGTIARLNWWIWNTATPGAGTSTTVTVMSNLAGSGAADFNLGALSAPFANNSLLFIGTGGAGAAGFPPVAGLTGGVSFAPVSITSTSGIGFAFRWDLSTDNGVTFTQPNGLTSTITGAGPAPTVGTNGLGGLYYRSPQVSTTDNNGNFAQGSARQIGANSGVIMRVYTVPAPASAALLGLGGLVATRRRRA